MFRQSDEWRLAGISKIPIGTKVVGGVMPFHGAPIMTDVTALPRLDLDKYLGRWYEICRLPIGWEDETATDITATYALNEDRNIRVDNRCFDEDGKPSRAIGEAVPVDDAKSRLKVTFLPECVRWIPFTKGDYWVLKIDPPYRTALVGTPDRKYLWILSRQPQLAEATKVEYLDEARQQDFDLANLITPLHTGREVSDAMVEGSWPSRRPTSLAANKTCITIQKL